MVDPVLGGASTAGSRQSGASASQSGMTRPDRIDLYRLAYDEEKRALDDQFRELEATRQRTAQFLTFVGATTAFLVGVGVKSPNRDWLFTTLAISGTLLASISLMLVVQVLMLVEKSSETWPPLRRMRWKYRFDGPALIRGIEPQVGTPLEADFYKDLVGKQHDARRSNDANMRKVRRSATFVILLGLVQLLCFTALVWLYA